MLNDRITLNMVRVCGWGGLASWVRMISTRPVPRFLEDPHSRSPMRLTTAFGATLLHACKLQLSFDHAILGSGDEVNILSGRYIP